MELNDLRSLVTVLLFFVFLGIVAWAWAKPRRAGFDEAARLALHDDGIDSAVQRSSNGARQ